VSVIGLLFAIAVSAADLTSSAFADTAQCLRFKQPLGYSASGAREQGDTKWYVLQLGDKGTVNRPLFPERQRERWARGSRWTAQGDTVLRQWTTGNNLRIHVSDGLVGWDISLSPGRDGYSGVATYLTDVEAAGWIPPRMEVSAIAISCPARDTY
jgi:hypothetical protein